MNDKEVNFGCLTQEISFSESVITRLRALYKGNSLVWFKLLEIYIRER